MPESEIIETQLNQEIATIAKSNKKSDKILSKLMKNISPMRSELLNSLENMSADEKLSFNEQLKEQNLQLGTLTNQEITNKFMTKVEQQLLPRIANSIVEHGGLIQYYRYIKKSINEKSTAFKMSGAKKSLNREVADGGELLLVLAFLLLFIIGYSFGVVVFYSIIAIAVVVTVVTLIVISSNNPKLTQHKIA